MTPDPDKQAERTLQNELEATLTELERVPVSHTPEHLSERTRLEGKRDRILGQLEPSECPPSKLDTVRAEVERLKAEVAEADQALELLNAIAQHIATDRDEALAQVAHLAKRMIRLVAENETLQAEIHDLEERLNNG